MNKPNNDLDTLVGSAVYSLAKSLIASGMTPTQAVSRVGFAIIEGALGRDVSRTLGVPRPTLSRWRREMAEASENAQDLDENALAADSMNDLLPALGFRDLRMTLGGKDEQ